MADEADNAAGGDVLVYSDVSTVSTVAFNIINMSDSPRTKYCQRDTLDE